MITAPPIKKLIILIRLILDWRILWLLLSVDRRDGVIANALTTGWQLAGDGREIELVRPKMIAEAHVIINLIVLNKCSFC